jgi:hypothetical protein
MEARLANRLGSELREDRLKRLDAALERIAVVADDAVKLGGELRPLLRIGHGSILETKARRLSIQTGAASLVVGDAGDHLGVSPAELLF